MLIAYKYRIYPDKEQETMLMKTFGCVRFIYNQMLKDKIEYYEKEKKTLYVTPAQYKDKYEWLKEVDAMALCNAQLNLNKAYNAFFSRPEVGYPNFKSRKNNHFSYTTNQNLKVTDRYLSVPKIKNIKIKKHRDFKGTIKSITISKEPSGKYFASVLVDAPDKEKLSTTTNNVGIDLGLKGFCITSDGEMISNPRCLKNSEEKLAKE